MGLEDEVKKIMEQPLEASPPLLEAMTAERDPNIPLTADDMFTLLIAQTAGLKRAILRLAREIEQMRNV
jgi:hypothetical protein